MENINCAANGYENDFSMQQVSSNNDHNDNLSKPSNGNDHGQVLVNETTQNKDIGLQDASSTKNASDISDYHNIYSHRNYFERTIEQKLSKKMIYNRWLTYTIFMFILFYIIMKSQT